jgi:hypothetical protein
VEVKQFRGSFLLLPQRGQTPRASGFGASKHPIPTQIEALLRASRRRSSPPPFTPRVSASFSSPQRAPMRAARPAEWQKNTESRDGDVQATYRSPRSLASACVPLVVGGSLSLRLAHRGRRVLSRKRVRLRPGCSLQRAGAMQRGVLVLRGLRVRSETLVNSFFAHLLAIPATSEKKRRRIVGPCCSHVLPSRESLQVSNGHRFQNLHCWFISGL